MTGNGNGKKKSRRRLLLAGIAGVVLLGVVGLVSASRGHEEIDSSKLAAIEKGDIARSVVATGKIEPLSKVEVKSKASGIVKEILRRVRRPRAARARSWSSSTRRSCRRACARRGPTLLSAQAALAADARWRR